VIIGTTPIDIVRDFKPFPAELVALTVKVNVFNPAAVGVPDISPVAAFRLKPVGRLPAAIDQVMGVVPVAASVWL